ncbi:hypothetical protein F3Y22_tig00014445pilonHSYRG00105 [Hibiscus syriacus]|uniref:Uncharacterized protein n=1 Tax=Hibiscus syriacus TaxID=106335 RepID=A0A6A3BYU4_HIBSY|nr:hypothetical protein F3Y22_tig00014445pilonHSYRG00105 [Hibiscus syriacus]
MDFITPLISIAERLCTAMASQASHVINLDRGIQSFAAALIELKDKRDDLRTLLVRAELDDLDEQMKQSRRLQGCLNPSCCLKYNLSKETIEKLKDLSELMGKGNFERLVTEPHPAPVEEKPCKPAIGISVMLPRCGSFLKRAKWEPSSYMG